MLRQKPTQILQFNTLLVPLEKLVPPCGFRRYPSNQYFRHTEIQSHACANLTNSTKAIWIIMFKIKWIVDFWNARRNINIEKINRTNLKILG